jgi:PS-10 peptidase S37
MRRLVLVSLLAAAACGDNTEPEGQGSGSGEPQQIVATCDEAQLDTLVAALPNVTSAVKTPCGGFVDGVSKCYLVTLAQPINYAEPTATFPQHLFVMHRGCDRPTVVADWGYSNEAFFDDELSVLFQANAIWIEHRYQGESIPTADHWDWTQLTIENGATDMHRVIESFKHLYGKNWVSTGASKGGITATYHSYFFPDDLNGAVPYVAPASRSRIDPTYQWYFDNVMVTPCAQRIRDAQVAALTTRRPMMLAHLTAEGAAGYEAEYLDAMTVSFDWGFWQYRGEPYCAQVPDVATTTDDAFWSFYASASGFFGPADQAKSDGALYYEWLTEQGFALQVGAHVKDLLTSDWATDTMEDNFHAQFPEVTLPAYDGYVTRLVRKWVREDAENVLLIYGQYDPWSGGAMDQPQQATSARYFVPGANHGASISGLAEAERTAAIAHAARMFGVSPVMTMMKRAAAANERRNAILGRTMQRVMLRRM